MSKEDAIACLAQVFREYGYEGTTLSRLSKATGLGKGTLYHYFPGGKEEMVRAVLDMLGEELEAKVLKPLQSEESPKKRLEAMSQGLQEFYQEGNQRCLLAVLLLGGASNDFQPQVEKALRHWIEEIATVLEEAGWDRTTSQQRAEDAIIQIQGSLLLTKAFRDTSYFKRTVQELSQVLLQELP